MPNYKVYCKHCKNEIIKDYVWVHLGSGGTNCMAIYNSVAEPYINPKNLKVFNSKDLLKLFE